MRRSILCPPGGRGGDLGKGLDPGVGILVKKFCPGLGGGATFYAEKFPKYAIFSKNRLFYEKFVPGGGELGKKSWPGVGEFGQNFKTRTTQLGVHKVSGLE